VHKSTFYNPIVWNVNLFPVGWIENFVAIHVRVVNDSVFGNYFNIYIYYPTLAANFYLAFYGYIAFVELPIKIKALSNSFNWI